ncbi:MAG: hypothetical protein J5666_01270 [Bacilli bacterium]|nr:hypothetical protein [Bacilli bacterium]
MIENEMANIKERLAKYIKYILIVSIVIFVISLVTVLYAHSREIMDLMGVPRTRNIAGQVVPINPGYYETFTSVLKNVFLAGHYGMNVKGAYTAEQEAAAAAFAEENLPVLVSTLKTLSIVGLAISVLPIVGGILYIIGTNKENNKLTKIAGYITLGAFALEAIFLLVYVLTLVSKGFILPVTSVLFIIASAFVIVSLLISVGVLVIRLFFKQPTRLVRSILTISAFVSALVGILLLFGGFLFALFYARELVIQVLSTADLFFVLALFCSAFGLFSYALLINNLIPLENNAEDNELYHGLKAMATENVQAKEARNRKKALR